MRKKHEHEHGHTHTHNRNPIIFGSSLIISIRLASKCLNYGASALTLDRPCRSNQQHQPQDNRSGTLARIRCKDYHCYELGCERMIHTFAAQKSTKYNFVYDSIRYFRLTSDPPRFNRIKLQTKPHQIGEKMRMNRLECVRCSRARLRFAERHTAHTSHTRLAGHSEGILSHPELGFCGYLQTEMESPLVVDAVIITPRRWHKAISNSLLIEPSFRIASPLFSARMGN